MTPFSADWLALREPADHAARADALTARLAERLAGRSGLRAVDLAAGSGSNVRYLLPRLAAVGHWTLVDHDEALLAHAQRLLEPAVQGAGASFDVRQADLRELSTLPLEGTALVTAAALLDLVSEAWLRALAARCREVAAHVLCTLSYDGRLECEPVDPEDRLVRDLVNRHQRTDKGFGPALGPDAARIGADCFRDEGFGVHTATSDWVLEASSDALQRELLEGWAGAAREVSPGEAAAVEAWLARRLGHVDAGVSRIRVGHLDLVATWPR